MSRKQFCKFCRWQVEDFYFLVLLFTPFYFLFHFHFLLRILINLAFNVYFHLCEQKIYQGNSFASFKLSLAGRPLLLFTPFYFLFHFHFLLRILINLAFNVYFHLLLPHFISIPYFPLLLFTTFCFELSVVM